MIKHSLYKLIIYWSHKLIYRDGSITHKWLFPVLLYWHTFGRIEYWSSYQNKGNGFQFSQGTKPFLNSRAPWYVGMIRPYRKLFWGFVRHEISVCFNQCCKFEIYDSILYVNKLIVQFWHVLRAFIPKYKFSLRRANKGETATTITQVICLKATRKFL